MPAELDEMKRHIMQMEIEEAALLKETDNLSKDRLENLQKELAENREQYNERIAKWENEKSSVDKVTKLKEEINDIEIQIDKAKREYDLNKAAELQYAKLPQLEKELFEAEESVKKRDRLY